MHELSIAQSIVELAEEVAKKEKACSIQSIEIEIGALSGVVIQALEFAMDVTVKNTMLKNSKINFIKINGAALCNNCKKEFKTNTLLAFCPDCKKANFTIIEGKQLRIKSLTI